MTVSTTKASDVFPGNGIATGFDCAWRIFDDTDILVSLVDQATGADTPLVLNTDYTISGAGDQAGFTVATMAPVASGTNLYVRRALAYEQPTDFTNQGAFFPTMHEDAMDRLSMQIQQLADENDRAIRLPAGLSDINGQVPELTPLAPLVVNAEGTGVESGSTELTGDMLLRPNLADTGLNKGAALVGFLQSGTGAVPRTLQSKNQDIVHADDFGLVGDGTTDETTKLQNLFNAAQGKTLMLGFGKSYAIATATGLSIPANTTLISNGSKFKRLTLRASGTPADSEYNITVGDDCVIDRLEVESVGGAQDIGGVCVAGSRVNIDTVKVTCGTSGSGSLGSLWNAVRIGPNSGTANDVHIGRVECSNYDRPVVVQNITRGSIGFVGVTMYRRGVYIKDCAHFSLRGGSITGLGPNSSGTAGDNGLLIESTAAHHSSNNIRIDNVTIEDSGEHGLRIGGELVVRNVWVRDCATRNTGAGVGTYPPASNGGCGFKVLGPTAVFGARHQSIHFINCTVEDIASTGIAALAARSGKANFSGFQMGKVFGGSIVNPIVTKRPADSGTYAETGNSCFNGIEIVGCQKITVTNPQIQRPYNSGIYIYDFTDGMSDWGQTDDIDIIGGHVQTPGVAGVEITCGTITMRRINVAGGLAASGGSYGVKVAKSGTGAFVGLTFDMAVYNQVTESFNGLGTDGLVHARGTFVGTNACKDGSLFQDINAATVKIRKAGAWTSL